MKDYFGIRVFLGGVGDQRMNLSEAFVKGEENISMKLIFRGICLPKGSNRTLETHNRFYWGCQTEGGYFVSKQGCVWEVVVTRWMCKRTSEPKRNAQGRGYCIR